MASWNSRPLLAAKFARLAPAERRACLRAAVWLSMAAVAVRVMSYASVSRMVGRIPSGRARAGALDDYAVAVARAARGVPGTTCLSQAFAAACMLRRDGRASVLSIGVNVDERRAFKAHAWLDVAGVRIIGARAGDLHVIVRHEIAARL